MQSGELKNKEHITHLPLHTYVHTHTTPLIKSSDITYECSLLINGSRQPGLSFGLSDI